MGYDGKGQVKVESKEDLKAAWDQIGNQKSILEEWITFEKEISVIASRNPNGEIVHFTPFENVHANHILDVTIYPALISDEIQANAKSMATQILESLNYVGVLCVEMFLKEDGSLLANEIAPRPHNSGHLTIEASTSSQYEQQVKALCNFTFGFCRNAKTGCYG